MDIEYKSLKVQDYLLDVNKNIELSKLKVCEKIYKLTLHLMKYSKSKKYLFQNLWNKKIEIQ